MSVDALPKDSLQALRPLLGDRSAWRVLRRCYAYLRSYWRPTLGAYLAVAAIDGLNVAMPQLIRGIIDRGLTGRDLAFAGWAAAALLGLAAIKGVVTFAQQRWLEVASQGVAYDLRNALQTKLTDLSFSFHDRSEAGQLLSPSASTSSARSASTRRTSPPS